MGLLVEFDVVDDFGFISETPEFGIVPDYSAGCAIFADTFLQVSQQLVPIDTGYLSSTLEAEGDDTYCRAETDCEYAQYPEYGTWCQAAQPYFTPALEEAIAAAEPYWIQAQDEAIEEEEMLIMEMEEEEEMARFSEDDEGGFNQWGGGLNFSSPGAFIGSLLGIFLAAFLIVTTQVIFGQDFRDGGHEGRRFSLGNLARIFIPDVIIT